MLESEAKDIGPWYRQRWPWYIIGMLLFGVVFALILVEEAVQHQDPLVVDDYYKAGLAINRVLDKQRTALDMGLQAHASYDATARTLTVRLTARQNVTAKALTLLFVHATLANRDYRVTLVRQGPDLYRAHLAKLRSGEYDLMLEPKNKVWRLDAHLSMPVQNWKLVPEL